MLGSSSVVLDSTDPKLTMGLTVRLKPTEHFGTFGTFGTIPYLARTYARAMLTCFFVSPVYTTKMCKSLHNVFLDLYHTFLSPTPPKKKTGKEDLDAATFASWGVDYLKHDDCGTQL